MAAGQSVGDSRPLPGVNGLLPGGLQVGLFGENGLQRLLSLAALLLIGGPLAFGWVQLRARQQIDAERLRADGERKKAQVALAEAEVLRANAEADQREAVAAKEAEARAREEAALAAGQAEGSALTDTGSLGEELVRIKTPTVEGEWWIWLIKVWRSL